MCSLHENISLRFPVECGQRDLSLLAVVAELKSYGSEPEYWTILGFSTATSNDRICPSSSVDQNNRFLICGSGVQIPPGVVQGLAQFGLERLPWKQEVESSNLSTLTDQPTAEAEYMLDYLRFSPSSVGLFIDGGTRMKVVCKLCGIHLRGNPYDQAISYEMCSGCTSRKIEEARQEPFVSVAELELFEMGSGD